MMCAQNPICTMQLNTYVGRVHCYTLHILCGIALNVKRPDAFYLVLLVVNEQIIRT
jgi:hypothetical protein